MPRAWITIPATREKLLRIVIRSFPFTAIGICVESGSIALHFLLSYDLSQRFEYRTTVGVLGTVIMISLHREEVVMKNTSASCFRINTVNISFSVSILL